jgi:hypothetical protein
MTVEKRMAEAWVDEGSGVRATLPKTNVKK